MSHLCEGPSTLSTLRALNLSGNSLGTEGIRHLGMVYYVHSSLLNLTRYPMKFRYKKLDPLLNDCVHLWFYHMSLSDATDMPVTCTFVSMSVI